MPIWVTRASVVAGAGGWVAHSLGRGQGAKDRLYRGKPHRLPCSRNGSPMPEGHLEREESFWGGQPLGPKSRAARDQVVWAKLQVSTFTLKGWKQRLAPERQQHWCRQDQDTGQVRPNRWVDKHCGPSIRRAGPSNEEAGRQPAWTSGCWAAAGSSPKGRRVLLGGTKSSPFIQLSTKD